MLSDRCGEASLESIIDTSRRTPERHPSNRNGVCVSRGSGGVLSLRSLRGRQPQPNHQNVRLPSPKVRQTDNHTDYS